MNFVKKWLFRLFLLIVCIIAFLAASDNSSEVTLVFLDSETPMWPISWWILSGFVLGVGFGLMLNAFSTTRLKLELRAAKKLASKSNDALDGLRAEVRPGPLEIQHQG
jgi:uncharacterized integral membrane protein